MSHVGIRMAGAMGVLLLTVAPVQPAIRAAGPVDRAAITGSMMGGPDNAGNATDATGP